LKAPETKRQYPKRLKVVFDYFISINELKETQLENDYLYIGNGFSNTVSVIDTNNNNTLVNTIPLDYYVEDLVFNSDKSYLYVTTTGSGYVSMMDTKSNYNFVTMITP
jgi:YVTN family beta-propeller protein